jgi:endonuclease/exonuclease/phosphatase family metal-dependent hydrolase
MPNLISLVFRVKFFGPFVLPSIAVFSTIWISMALLGLWLIAVAVIASYVLYVGYEWLESRKRRHQRELAFARILADEQQQSMLQQQSLQPTTVSNNSIGNSNGCSATSDTILGRTSVQRRREISVLTYNLFLRPPFVKNNADDFKNERLQEFLRVLDRFDVVCLQEVFSLGNLRQRRLIRCAERLGFHWHVRSYRPPLLMAHKFIDGGLLILSRLPIVAKDCHVYRHGHQIDEWATKQVIYAKVRLTYDNYMHLFTTHMQASYYDNSDDLNTVNDHMRTCQVTEMAEFVARKRGADSYAALVTGDFNVNARCDVPVHARAASNKLEVLAMEEGHEYRHLLQQLSNGGKCTVVDLLKRDSDGQHPNTYGDVDMDGKPRELVLTHWADHCTQMCIDYLLWMNGTGADAGERLRSVHGSTRVEEFLVDNRPFTQISDHYGVSTRLEFEQ